MELNFSSLQAIKHATMLQDELDALKTKLDEQKQSGNLNIKLMTQEIVRMTEVILSYLSLFKLEHFCTF